jgi:hypothetical protein
MNIENNVIENKIVEEIDCQSEKDLKIKCTKIIYIGDKTKTLLNSFIRKNKLKKNLKAIQFIVENKSILSLYEKERESAINDFRRNIFKKYPKNGIYASSEEEVIKEFNELKQSFKIKTYEELIYVFITLFNKVSKNKIKEVESEMTNETITEELRNLRNDIEKLKKELNII